MHRFLVSGTRYRDEDQSPPGWRTAVLVNGKPWHEWKVTSTPKGTLIVMITYPASNGLDRVDIQFGGR